jgi:hypothetical protein
VKRVILLPSFERGTKKFTPQEKEKLKAALTAFNRFLESNEHAYGFRFKKIGQDHFEFRIDLSLRVITKREGDTYYLVLAGNHEDVRRYLRSYRL